MTQRALAAAILALVLAGCGESAEDRRAETLASDAVITPGIYGDVRDIPEAGDLLGFELSLPQGSNSPTVEFVDCEGWCNEVERAEARRGLGGITFAYQRGDRTIDVTVQPAGPDAVTLGADWGNGFVERRLPRIERPYGLEVARGPASE